MADRYIFSTALNAKAVLGGFTRVVSGGTLTGTDAVFNVVFDDTAFSGAEGKEKLIFALEETIALLEDLRTDWPLVA